MKTTLQQATLSLILASATTAPVIYGKNLKHAKKMHAPTEITASSPFTSEVSGNSHSAEALASLHAQIKALHEQSGVLLNAIKSEEQGLTDPVLRERLLQLSAVATNPEYAKLQQLRISLDGYLVYSRSGEALLSTADLLFALPLRHGPHTLEAHARFLSKSLLAYSPYFEVKQSFTLQSKEDSAPQYYQLTIQGPDSPADGAQLSLAEANARIEATPAATALKPDATKTDHSTESKPTQGEKQE